MSAQHVVVRAPAKVNLFLGVGRARDDGYHEVRTVMHAVALADTVRLEPANELSVVVRGTEPCPPHENLAWTAASRVADATGRHPAVRITIDKRIPSGAGLGGGSSDAAAVLVGLAELWGGIPDERLLSIAETLGSDVPFFLSGGAARFSGRGELLDATLAPIDVPLLLVQPPAALSTAAVYVAFDRAPLPSGTSDAVEAALGAGDPVRLGAALANNLTDAAGRLEARVTEALRWVGQAPGVLGSAMTGSGSAVFAVCRDDATALDLEREASARGWWSKATRTTHEGAAITS